MGTDADRLEAEAQAFLAGAGFADALAAFLAVHLQPLLGLVDQAGGDPDRQVERAAAQLLRKAADAMVQVADALDSAPEA